MYQSALDIIKSERKDLYGEIAKKLVDTGWAYYDDTTSEELKELRDQQIREKNRNMLKVHF